MEGGSQYITFKSGAVPWVFGDSGIAVTSPAATATRESLVWWQKRRKSLAALHNNYVRDAWCRATPLAYCTTCTLRIGWYSFESVDYSGASSSPSDDNDLFDIDQTYCAIQTIRLYDVRTDGTGSRTWIWRHRDARDGRPSNQRRVSACSGWPIIAIQSNESIM